MRNLETSEDQLRKLLYKTEAVCAMERLGAQKMRVQVDGLIDDIECRIEVLSQDKFEMSLELELCDQINRMLDAGEGLDVLFWHKFKEAFDAFAQQVMPMGYGSIHDVLSLKRRLRLKMTIDAPETSISSAMDKLVADIPRIKQLFEDMTCTALRQA